MFNLLVSADGGAWDGSPVTYPLTRAVREYTDDALQNRFSRFEQASVEALLRLPAIFAYEEPVGQDPKFGKLAQITKRANRLEVRLDYELISVSKFLSNAELWSMASELDLGNWEANRSHWAVKDVDLSRELAAKGIMLPAVFAASTPTNAAPASVDVTKHVFDVAFSFPGEYRATVEAVAKEAVALLGAHSCFYDFNYQAQLARPSLDLLLQDIYGKRSRLLVVFIGKDYQRKTWPNIEWNAIRSVIVTARAAGRIMYVRVDDGEVDGVFPQDGYIQSNRFSPAQIAAFIAERVEFLPPAQHTT
jgi:hypothetical protein